LNYNQSFQFLCAKILKLAEGNLVCWPLKAHQEYLSDRGWPFQLESKVNLQGTMLK
jgi:hypothetical protein